MKKLIPPTAAGLVLFATAAPALAYVGPGAGLSMLGALWGLLVAVLAALGFIILWPLRRYRRRRAQARAETAHMASPRDDASDQHPGDAHPDHRSR